jgi:hypothetical protein
LLVKEVVFLKEIDIDEFLRESGTVSAVDGEPGKQFGRIKADEDGREIGFEMPWHLKNPKLTLGDRVTFERESGGESTIVAIAIRKLNGIARTNPDSGLENQKFMILVKRRGDRGFRDVGQGLPWELRQRHPLNGKGKSAFQGSQVIYRIWKNGHWEPFEKDPRTIGLKKR